MYVNHRSHVVELFPKMDDRTSSARRIETDRETFSASTVRPPAAGKVSSDGYSQRKKEKILIYRMRSNVETYLTFLSCFIF